VVVWSPLAGERGSSAATPIWLWWARGHPWPAVVGARPTQTILVCGGAALLEPYLVGVVAQPPLTYWGSRAATPLPKKLSTSFFKICVKSFLKCVFELFVNDFKKKVFFVLKIEKCFQNHYQTSPCFSADDNLLVSFVFFSPSL